MKNIIRYTLITGLFLTLMTWVLEAQTTSVQLPTEADSTGSFRIVNSTGVIRFQSNSDGGLYLGGVFGTGVIPTLVKTARLMWYPGKAAFRVGEGIDATWDNTNIGDYSGAIGYNPKASGSASIAIGYQTTASGNWSTAAGYWSEASGNNSVALGNGASASGSSSVSIGYSTTSTGTSSVAIGYAVTARGNFSTAMGNGTNAGGISSTAIGLNTAAGTLGATAFGCYTVANGSYSTAMGNYVKTNHSGSCIIGDYSKSTLDSSSANNEMTMRFSGGYRLFSNSACTTGVTLASGGSSWGTVSDSTKKTNFEYADGESFLRSLSKLRLGSWNYIGQDAKTFRHYGPMAQEIFHHFGKDEYGTIGNDTTLSTADMDGIMMICLQALEMRTTELNTALNELKAEKEKTVQLHVSFDELKKEIAKMKGELQLLTESKTRQTSSDVTLNTIQKGNEK